MKPAVPNYLHKNCNRADSHHKRGISHMIELRESLDTVNLKLGAMSVSTGHNLSHKKSKARMSAQKIFVVGGMEAVADESINIEQSSKASPDESDAKDTTNTMHHFQPRTPCDSLATADGANSIILSMLKTSGKTRSARPSTSIGLFDGGSRSFNGKRDRNVSPIKTIGHSTNEDDVLNEKLSQIDAHVKEHDIIDSSRKEWRKISVMNKFLVEESEVGSHCTDTESPDDGTLVNHSIDGTEHTECITPTSRAHLAADFPDLHQSPSSNTTFESSEQGSDNDIFDEDDSVIHAMPMIKLDVDSLYAQKQASTKHRRNISTNSFTSNSTKTSVPLRARSRTNDGMLELKTGISTANTPKKLIHPHRRKISMNLPIKAQSSQQCVFPTPAPRVSIFSEITPSVSGMGERELEYKHRHTFIGTASLDDFLEILELCPDHTTTRAKVAKTFVILASTEQLLARQSSAHGTGWELVSRIIPDVASGHADYLAQAQIKLGSLTLHQFLELIPFDEKDITKGMGVVEAFCAASHMDKTAGSSAGAGSKSKAFRSWMLRK